MRKECCSLLITPTTSLICSSNPNSWPQAGKMLFLGEWCKPYASREIWQIRDYSVADPYGVSVDERIRDAQISKKIYLSILPDLQISLNQLHSLNEPISYWEIVIGHWLDRSIKIILNRFESLRIAVGESNSTQLNLVFNSNYSLTTKDSQTWFWAINDDSWNNVLIARFLKFVDLESCRVELKKIPEVEFSFANDVRSTQSGRLTWRSKLKNFAGVLGKLAQRDTDGFFLSTYLPRKVELLTQIFLGQWPQFPNQSYPAIPELGPSMDMREELRSKLVSAEGTVIEQVVRDLLSEMIPKSFVENFRLLKENGNQMGWPNRPRFIFTSNNYDSDEVFKIWAASKVSNGSRYLIGQHGNVYGTHKFVSNPSLEETISHKFITWGWGASEFNTLPAFNFKVAGKKSANFLMKQQKILLVEIGHDRGISTWDDTFEIDEYYNDQFLLVSKLRPFLKEKLVVKLYYDHLFTLASQKLRWQDFDNSIVLENSTSFEELTAKSRLIIFSYDSTGMLELLTLNRPVMAFWQNGTSHIRDEALPFYQQLIAAGIVHTNTDTLANLINSKWETLESWWESEKVQSARINFCNAYSRPVSKPATNFRNVMKLASVPKESRAAR